MNSILLKLIKKLVNPVRLVTWALHQAGDGGFGPAVQKAYWFLAGKKSWIIAIVSAAGAFLVELQASPADCNAIRCDVLLEYLKTWGPAILGALTVSALDDAVRRDPPSRP